MTPSLMPVQRPDKNGKMVTRWVRPEAQGSSGRAIPPVTAPIQPLHRDTVFNLIGTELKENDYDQTNCRPFRELVERASSIKDETMSNYLDANKEYPGKHVIPLLMSALHNGDSNSKTQYLLDIIKYDSQIDPEWSDYVGGTYSYSSASSIYKGLKKYEYAGFKPPRALNDESSPAVIKTRAMIQATMKLWEEGIIEEEAGNDYVAIEDGNLASLILDHPEDVDEIVETVKATGSTDGKRIKEMMATSSSSMRSGVL